MGNKSEVGQAGHQLKVEGIERREALTEERKEIQIVGEVRRPEVDVTNKVYGRGRQGEEELTNGNRRAIKRENVVKQERNGPD